MNEPALQLRDIERRYAQVGGGLHVLRGASLRLERGEAVALVGPSGAGKSTLLHVAGLLEPPDSGQVFVDGEDGARLGDAGRTLIRRRKLGFVYQFHHLLPDFSALDNVALPLRLAGRAEGAIRQDVDEILDWLGLREKSARPPAELSGGEQQRIAIARAIITRPSLLIADEPTSELDVFEARRLIALFGEMNRLGTAIVVATHSEDLPARHPARIITLAEGRIIDAP